MWNQLTRRESDLHCVRGHPSARPLRRGRFLAACPVLFQERYPPPLPLPAAGAGLTPNVAGALAYLVGAITGILFLVIDPFKTDRFVRFHAFSRSSLTWPGSRSGSFWTIVGLMLGAVAHGLFFIIQLPINLLIYGRWILPAGLPDVFYTAYQGETEFQITGNWRTGGEPRPARTGHRTASVAVFLGESAWPAGPVPVRPLRFAKLAFCGVVLPVASATTFVRLLKPPLCIPEQSQGICVRLRPNKGHLCFAVTVNCFQQTDDGSDWEINRWAFALT